MDAHDLNPLQNEWHSSIHIECSVIVFMVFGPPNNIGLLCE